MFLNHICLPMHLKILFYTPNLAISTSLNCWSVLYWTVRRESMLLFRHWQEELPWAHSAEQGTMRSTTIRGINDSSEALNFYLGNSVVRFCVSFIELINLWEIHNKYEKYFIYLQLWKCIPHTRNAQEVLRFHAQKCCHEFSKYYYFCIKISTFGFCFPHRAQPIKLFSLTLYLSTSCLLSNFWHLTNENENIYFQFHYKVAKELINCN